MHFKLDLWPPKGWPCGCQNDPIDQNSLHVLSRTKGQLISKWFLGSSISSKKTNDWIQLYLYDTLGWLVFVHFLEEIEDIKKTFQNYLSFIICFSDRNLSRISVEKCRYFFKRSDWNADSSIITVFEFWELD